MKILLTDNELKHTLAAVRYLALEGYQVSVLESKYGCCHFSRYVNRYIVYNIRDSSNIGDYRDIILDEIKKNKYDLLIPISAYSVKCVAKYNKEFNKHTNIVVANYKKVNIALSKKLSYNIVKNMGIPAPATFFPQEIDELDNLQSRITYPIVIKALLEGGGGIVDYAYDYNDLLTKYNLMCKERGFYKGNLPMLQEYIDGIGWGLFALYESGSCKRIFMHRRIREYPPSGGPSCCAESVYDESLKYYGIKILDYLEWNGVAMVEFRRRHDDGKFFFMEINPKFWGSLELSLAAGVNFPVLLARMAAGENIGYSERYKVGLRFHWSLEGDIKHALKRPGEA